MGCSSSRTIEKTNHSKIANSSGKFEKEKKIEEAIFISKKIPNACEIQDKIINLIEKNENQLVKNKHEKLENDKANLNSNAHPSAVNSDLNIDNPVLKIDANLGEKRNLAFDGNKNLGKFNSNNANNNSDLSNFNKAELNKNNSEKSSKNVTTINNNYNASRDKKISDNLILTANNNSKGFQNKEKNINTIRLLKEDCDESAKLKPPTETVLKEQFDIEGDKNINCEIKINKNNLNNNIENDSVISKLSSNLIKSKAQIFKDTNTAKDENELILNLTKTQNLTHFQDDNQTKNLLNSIDKDDNLLIKFNTGAVANSLLNNTNFKINESQSQQNISNIHNNPSICEENKSDRLSFKFDLTSNFDLHSRFSKFDSTNNISRIKVPYYENHNNNNNNNEQNYLLTNVSHINDLNNLTNLNNNFNSNVNNNNNGNYKGLRNQPVNSKAQEKDLQSSGKKVHKESNENMDEEEIQLSITISVRASKFEAMYPIWIEKNREVEFKVIGKWTIDNTFPMCDCNGYQIKNKKEAFSNNNNTNANTNNNSIVTISNYNTASTNNTNVNIYINSKNINVNSKNLVLLNTPTANKVKDMQEEMNKGFNAVEVDKKSSNAISALLATPESVNNANVNVNIENTNINKNEIKISYIGPSTIIVNDNNIKSEFNSSEKNIDQPKSNCANYNQPNNIDDTSNKNSNKTEIYNNNNQNNLDENNKNNSSNKNSNNATNNNNSLNCLLENYPNGCLIGRVLGGPYFRISSKCTYISEHSGPLFLKMNIHDLRLNPEGKLSVFINGADDLPFMSIEKKLGWDINSFSLGCQLLKTESERLIYTFINKIRINSNLFAQQYLENIKTLSNATNNLYLCFFKNAKTFKLLNMDGKLIEYGKRLLKREIERLYNLSTAGNLINNGFNNNNNNNNNLINSNNPSAKNRQEILESENKQILEYEKNLSLNGYSNLKYFIKKHEDTKPLSVAIKLIIDEKARQEILNKNNDSVGLVTIKLPQAQKGFYTCLVFGNLNSEQNLITEINRNESEIMITE